jgi:hypothetical protein
MFYITERVTFPPLASRSSTALMSGRNTRTRQPSPPPTSADESSEASQAGPRTAPQGSAGRQSRRRMRACQDVGEEIDITLSDENTSIPSQPNSQTARAEHSQTSNNSRTPASSRGGTRGKALDIKHFFRKTRNKPTICMHCE